MIRLSLILFIISFLAIGIGFAQSDRGPEPTDQEGNCPLGIWGYSTLGPGMYTYCNVGIGIVPGGNSKLEVAGGIEIAVGDFIVNRGDAYFSQKIQVEEDAVVKGQMSVGGNACFVSGPYNLFVQGGIQTDEVKVSTGWCDYVFEDDYDLPSIESVEAFIEENGHLPNTPSEKEVIEAGGIELGETSLNQQEKIEELFLYIIDLNKEIKDLKKQNETLLSLVNKK